VDACVPALFEAVVAERPDAVAVVDTSGENTDELTYAQVNSRANQVARHLAARGVRPDDLVGILLERSADFVIAALAVLKAGAGYVPMDPGDPPARISAMVARVGTTVLVTHRRWGARLEPASTTVVYLDQPHVDGYSPTNLKVTISPLNLAYAMFTSGSTGGPKGVLVPHRAVVRLVRGAGYTVLDHTRTIAQVSSLSFDAATFEIWGALLNGGRLVIGSAKAPGLDEIVRLVQEHRVTTIFVTTRLFHLLIDERVAGLRGLYTVLTGGETIAADRVRAAVEGLPGCRIVHVYGPTENTTFSTFYEVPREFDGAGPVPIGGPIGGTHVRILDDELNPVPAGTAGQLFVGGGGLARGYLADPALTAQRFVPDPFATRPGERLYATGDLARHRSDGAVEFLGRLDDQVKVRGFRVEPGEIEEALRAHPDVRDAAVVPVAEPSGGWRLAAHVVLEPTPDGDRDATLSRVRAWLRERLPRYLVPALWRATDRIPLGPTGKTDRARLAASVSGHPVTGGEPAHRGTAGATHEQVIADVWADVLGLPAIGGADDFFELGGHSLSAIKAVARLREALGVELAPGAVFDFPTVAALAAHVRSGTLDGSHDRKPGG
jgi:amino acid adenylation domain-containing protein